MRYENGLTINNFRRHCWAILCCATLLFTPIAGAQECGDSLGVLTPQGAYDRVDVFDDLALVRDIEFRRVATIDVSDPGSPQEVGTYDPGEDLVADVAVYADVGFLAHGSDLVLLDLADPAVPGLLSAFEVVGALTHVDAWGDLAVAYDLELRRISIFDVSNPSLPGLVGNYSASGPIEDLTLFEGLVYVSRGSSMEIVDVSDPAAPILVEFLINIPTIATGAVGGAPDQLMVVSREFAGLDDNVDILDASAPADGLPRLASVTYDRPEDVSVSSCRGFVVGPTLEVFDLAACGACRIRCAPDDETLCLGENGRFRVTVTWRTAGNTGPGHAVHVGRRDSGTFWFFGPNNLELLIKVLDACQLEPFESFWVLYSASTDQGFTVRVEDLLAQVEKSYENELGMRSPATIDTGAFRTCAIQE